MTAKQMKRWERWHLAGKTAYQWRNALGSGIVFCVVFFALQFIWRDDISWTRGLGIGIALAFVNFLTASSIWQHKEAEFAKHSHPST